MYRYVIFDLDGTLLNTLDDLMDAGNWVCANHGWPTHTAGEFRRFVGNGLVKLAQRFSPEDQRSPEQIRRTVEEFAQYYGQHRADKTAPYPGLPALLRQLQQDGVEMAVLTNKVDNIARLVVEEYFPGVFRWVQGSQDGMPAKPDPALLHQLMDNMGADAQNTLFVGDSDVDIQTAKNGGLKSCGVLWGFRDREELKAQGADMLVSTAEELYQAITERN